MTAYVDNLGHLVLLQSSTIPAGFNSVVVAGDAIVFYNPETDLC
jgi:hypothetical protein